MRKFNRVAIIGVGLIGGSLGLAIRKRRLAKKVVGVCRTLHSVRLARKLGAIDWGTMNPVQAVRGADLVILAIPISLIHPIARQIAPHLKPGCLVTDVASTKQKVVRDLKQIFPFHVRFVGSHPLAGREKKGVAYASADLFQNAPCFVVPTRHSHAKSIQAIRRFWEHLGASVILIDAKRHDVVVSQVSHLPHIVATLLVLSAGKTPWVGSGFIDTTRIASSDPTLWRDILLSNQKEILRSLGHFRKRVEAMAHLLKHKKERAILKQLKQAKRLRDRLTP